jgi:hypothetical protein
MSDAETTASLRGRERVGRARPADVAGVDRIGRVGAGPREDTGWARPFSLPPIVVCLPAQGEGEDGNTLAAMGRPWLWGTVRREWARSSRVAIRVSVREPPYVVPNGTTTSSFLAFVGVVDCRLQEARRCRRMEVVKATDRQETAHAPDLLRRGVGQK